MKAKLVERGSEVNQTFLRRGHAGLKGCFVAVGDGFAEFVDGRVLDEIMLKTGVGWTEGHRCRSITVVNNIEGGEQKRSLLPRTPLVVGVD